MSDDVRQLDDCLSVRAGALFVEGCARRRSLPSRFGTPLYVVSEDQLRRNARALGAAFRLTLAGLVRPPALDQGQPVAGPAPDPHRGGAGLRRLRGGRARGRPADRDRTRPDLAERPDEGRRAARARRSAPGSGSPSTAARSSSARRGVARAARHASARSACASVPTWSAATSPRRCRRPELSVRDAIQRYKAGIPTEDVLAISEDEIRDPNLDLAGIHLHVGRHSTDPGDLARGDRLAGRRCSSRLRLALGRLDAPRARPRRRLPGPARSVRPDAAPACRRCPGRSPRHRRATPRRSAQHLPRGSSGSDVEPARCGSRSSPGGRCTRTPASTWRRWATSSARRSRAA